MTAGHCTRAAKGKTLFIDAGKPRIPSPEHNLSMIARYILNLYLHTKLSPGDHDLSTDDDTPNQMIQVSQVHQHPEYDFHTYNNGNRKNNSS